MGGILKKKLEDKKVRFQEPYLPKFRPRDKKNLEGSYMYMHTVESLSWGPGAVFWNKLRSKIRSLSIEKVIVTRLVK